MSLNLFELTAGYVDLLDLSEESDEDFTEAFDALEDDLDAKVDNCAAVVRTLEAESAAFKAESDRMSDRAKSLANRAKALKLRVLQSMDAAGKPKCKGRFTVSAKDGPEGVIVDDLTQVPAEYLKAPKPQEADKAAIKLAFKTAGECVPGTRVERKRTLSIR